MGTAYAISNAAQSRSIMSSWLAAEGLHSHPHTTPSPLHAPGALPRCTASQLLAVFLLQAKSVTLAIPIACAPAHHHRVNVRPLHACWLHSYTGLCLSNLIATRAYRTKGNARLPPIARLRSLCAAGARVKIANETGKAYAQAMAATTRLRPALLASYSRLSAWSIAACNCSAPATSATPKLAVRRTPMRG